MSGVLMDDWSDKVVYDAWWGTDEDDYEEAVKSMYHKTKTGTEIPIPLMGDQHLVNTIQLKLNRISDLQKRILEFNNTFKERVPKKLAFMFDDCKYDVETLKNELAKSTQSLYPYIFYACLRPTICDEVLVQLQDTFNDKDEV